MAGQPNILLINCDDLGYGDLGCYGSELNRTPALDRLAAQGLRCTDFYMASAVCSPSRGAMLTGCYPPRIGFGLFEGKYVLFPGQGVGLSSHEVTIASLLRSAGYATKLVGKWHCGDQPAFLPTRHGFDSYYGLPYSNDMGRQSGGRQPDWPPPLPLLRDEEVIQAQPDQTSLTERYVEESVRFLRANRDRPFFLYLAHMHVHLPHYPPQCFLDRAANGPYGAAVECIDWSVSVLLAELARLGLDERTLVIFTSDNGSRGDRGGSNGPLRGHKTTTWEGGFRVPCLVRWPGSVPPGQVCSALLTSLDFLPTFCALAGVVPPSDRRLDGHDVRAVWQAAPDATSPTEAFFYYWGDELSAVRCGRWKLHVARRAQEVCELYDLVEDVGETTDLAAVRPDIVAGLQVRAAACRDELGDSRLGLTGHGRRPCGRVDHPVPLTTYDPEQPYIIAEYDLPDRG